MHPKYSAISAACLAVLLTLPIGPVHASGFRECGLASWYNLRGLTASGTQADPETLTAAHRRLPFGTKVKVRNMHNGRELIVTIDDRGPFVEGRIIDVSEAAAEKLGFKSRGLSRVEINTLHGEAPVKPRHACKG